MGAQAGSTVVLSQSRSATERDLLDRWAAEHHPGAVVVRVDPRQPRLPAVRLERFLAGDVGGAGGGGGAGDGDGAETGGRADDTDPDARVVVPVRVAWIPDEDLLARRGRLSDLVSIAGRRQPWAPLHKPLLSRVPGAARVVAGEPATVGALRARFDAEIRTDGGFPVEDGFARYVVGQGLLACDRVERRIAGDRYKVPRLIVEQITASTRFAELVRELAAETGRGRADVEDTLRGCLREMVAVQSPLAIDSFRALMGPLHSKAWNVDVDEAGLERLRELNQQHPLVFLPSHRSYVDPLLFAEVLDARDFPRNHVLGGNNMAFGPIGPLGRRAGVVFIRRSFGDDVIYKAAIREYFGHLLAKRFNLEWYIEGGRTRTGKLRRPRYGLLRYLADALDDRPGLDAVLVPVSIVYDQLHEVGAMAAEQKGAAKRTEGLRWLARYFRDQRRASGVARVRFGEPFSLRQALGAPGGGARLEKVAFRVCVGINSATPATSTSLVTFALQTTGDRALTLDQMADVVAPLAELLEDRGVTVPVHELRTQWGLCETLDRLTEAGVVRMYADGSEPVFSVEPGRHHVAAFYRNGALHHLVNRALAELAVLRVSRAEPGEDLMQLGWTYLWSLRDLLKFEFFFSEKEGYAGEVIAEVDRLYPAWRDPASGRGDAERALRWAPILVAHGTLRTIFDAQLVVAEVLADLDHDIAVERTELLQTCLGLGRQLLLQRKLDRADSVSAELYDSALRLAENRRLVEPGGPEVGTLRREYLAEVRAVLDDLARIGRLETDRLARMLATDNSTIDADGRVVPGPTSRALS